MGMQKIFLANLEIMKSDHLWFHVPGERRSCGFGIKVSDVLVENKMQQL